MKTALLSAIMTLAATAAASAALPLQPGHVDVDFSAGTSVSYSYSSDTDRMLCFSNLTNVNVYTYQVTPTDKCYGESFKGVSYVQIQKGVDYTIEVTKGFTNQASSFDFEAYDSPWPDGGTWETAVRPSARFAYVPVTLNLPSHLIYEAAEDGSLSVFVNAYVTLKVATTPDGPFTDVTTSYQNGGGYKGSLDVTAGQTYYFTAEAYGSFLCSFELLHPVIGASPDFPYTISTGEQALFPKEAGTYYYKVSNSQDGFMLICGDEPFSGTAKAGTSFTYLSEESTGRIRLRLSVAESYTEYCIVLTRDAEAPADQHFSASYSDDPADVFPGERIEAGTYTTPDFGGLYFYTFSLPADGSNIISLKALGENLDETTSATLYFANNQYNSLARGAEIEFEAVAGRDYAVSWRVAAADAPLTFTLGFKSPGLGQSPSNPFPAKLGENSGKGAEAVYFRYEATTDGWLVITPAAGAGTPSVSMLPIPSDPYTQACEVIAEGGSFRVAATKGRGYLIVFNTAENVTFTLAEQASRPGESPSNPLATEQGIAEVPDSIGTFWFTYTTARDGKLDISTNIAFISSENRQDYSYVRLYNPSDPDNFIAELRPDYDLHVFANRVLDTVEGTTYLVKVRTMEAKADSRVTLVVRDPIAGEVPELPIEIPFDGVSTTYTFNRPVNRPEDAIWYGINLPRSGNFTIEGTSGGTIEMNMYAPGNLKTPLAATDIIDIVYDEEEEMYFYTWGIKDLAITEAGTYLLHVVSNDVPIEMTITLSGKDAIGEVKAPDSGAEIWHDLSGRRYNAAPSRPGLYIRNGEKVIVR